MEDYIQTTYYKFPRLIKENDKKKLFVLFEHDKGIENFNITPDGIFLEFNSYIYTLDQLEEILNNNGFPKQKEKKSGFMIKQINNLAESNKRTFGDQKLSCCQ